MEGLAGNAGWAGAGLLGLVLVWLFFFHLPAKDKQVKELTDQLIAMTEKNAALINSIADKHKAALDVVVTHCKEDSTRLVEAFRAELSNNKPKAGRA